MELIIKVKNIMLSEN